VIIGAIAGFVAWVGDVAIGGGESQVQAALDGGHTFSLIAIVFLVRFVLGPLCYAPGLPGGLFAPLLVIGSFAGLLIGKTMEAWVPGLTPPLPAIAATGMGALFVAVVRAPVTGIALVVEMTGVTSLFVPLLTACASATAVPALLGSRPIYDTLQERDAGHRESAERWLAGRRRTQLAHVFSCRGSLAQSCDVPPSQAPRS
jgi:CIC family chloride channel protein